MSELNYQEAFEELQQIVTEMEEGQITVDELTEKVSRAAVLIKVCKEKLNMAEQNVQEILSSIESQEIMDSTAASNDEDNSAEEDDNANEDDQSEDRSEEDDDA